MTKRIIVKGLADKELEKTLVSRGVPAQDLPSRNIKFIVDDCLVRIDPDIPNVVSRTVSPAKQLKLLQSFIDHPLRSSTTMCISSFPSDLRAKHLAIYLMALATKLHKEGQHKPGRALPLWHRVYGGYSNSLVDKPMQEIPSLLIITNVNVNSSPLKIEKVRDIIEKYSEIPKIVVTGGEPPCNLFANKLFSPLRIGIYLGPNNRVRVI